MEISEKELEELMYEDLTTTNGKYLNRIGFHVSCMLREAGDTTWLRQVRMEPYGIADIIGYRRSRGYLIVDIIELKNRPLEAHDFDQVLRYQTAIYEMLKNSRNKMRVSVESTLVGRGVNSGHYIHNYGNVNVFSFNYGLKGFDFELNPNSWCKNGGRMMLDSFTAAETKTIRLVQPSTSKPHAEEIH
jgi:hypothetical protein